MGTIHGRTLRAEMATSLLASHLSRSLGPAHDCAARLAARLNRSVCRTGQAIRSPVGAGRGRVVPVISVDPTLGSETPPCAWPAFRHARPGSHTWLTRVEPPQLGRFPPSLPPGRT